MILFILTLHPNKKRRILTKIETFFETLKNEGLYDARIVIAGKEYHFPGKTDAFRKPSWKLRRILKYASPLILLVIIGFVLLSVLPDNSRLSKKNTAEITDMPGESETNQTGPQTAAPRNENKAVPSQALELAGIRFHAVTNNEYLFKHISEKVFLYKLKSPGSDIRLTLNDTIDKINKQANKIRLEASVLTSRFMINEQLLKLRQGGFLEKWQILATRKGEALLVTNITPDTVSTMEISGWETLSGNKNVFTRIILKEKKD